MKGKYYKILRADRSSTPMKYKLGINKIPENWDFSKEGIYFTSIKHLFEYINYGPIVAAIDIPSDAIVIEDQEVMYIDGPLIDGWRADKIEILNFYDITDLTVFIRCIELGAIVNDVVIQWALYHAPHIWKYLYEEYKEMCQKVLDEIEENELCLYTLDDKTSSTSV